MMVRVVCSTCISTKAGHDVCSLYMYVLVHTYISYISYFARCRNRRGIVSAQYGFAKGPIRCKTVGVSIYLKSNKW